MKTTALFTSQIFVITLLLTACGSNNSNGGSEALPGSATNPSQPTQSPIQTSPPVAVVTSPSTDAAPADTSSSKTVESTSPEAVEAAPTETTTPPETEHPLQAELLESVHLPAATFTEELPVSSTITPSSGQTLNEVLMDTYLSDSKTETAEKVDAEKTPETVATSDPKETVQPDPEPTPIDSTETVTTTTTSTTLPVAESQPSEETPSTPVENEEGPIEKIQVAGSCSSSQSMVLIVSDSRKPLQSEKIKLKCVKSKFLVHLSFKKRDLPFILIKATAE